MKSQEPLLKIGIFGCHVIDLPNNKFGYAGQVHQKLVGKTFPTRKSAELAFMLVFKTLSNDFKSANIKNLRKDLIKYV